MGSWLSRRRPASEELETLSAQMKRFRADIEWMSRQRRNTLWYLSIMLFLATSAASAYAFIASERRPEQIGFSVGAVFLGGLLLVLCRRLICYVFDFLVKRKQSYLDELIAKKKTILENVKETETFKVAQELLSKYDDDYVKMQQQKQQAEQQQQLLLQKPASQPSTPAEMRKAAQGSGQITPMHMRARAMTQVPYTPSSNANVQSMMVGPVPGGMGVPSTPMGRPPPPGAFNTNSAQRPRTLAPVRPFAQEAKTNVDKVMDYFFGDGPNSRLALICAQCHVHNGMAFPGEFEYLAYVCYMCGHFNPARKMRSTPSVSTAATPAMSRQPSTRSLALSTASEERGHLMREDEKRATTEEEETESDERDDVDLTISKKDN